MTKQIVVVMMAVVLCAGMALAEYPYQVAWTAQIGSSSNDSSNSVAVDASGNAYISGVTFGSLGGTNAGGADAFLTKFDSSGNELWSQQIGTASTDSSRSVAVDASGNVYISGRTEGNLGGTNAGGADAFLSKFDSSGNELWSQQIGTATYDYSNSVAVDASGNAYISGYTLGSLGGPHAGSYDAFLVKFDSSGNELWSQQIGTSSTDQSWSVAVDAAGNAYISGYTGGSLGGTNAGSFDAFLTKFDSSGNELWSQQIGTSSSDQSHSVAVDASGNAYISGYTYGSLGGTNAGSYDAFLTKFDSSGNELWSQQIGTSSGDLSWSVAVDASGNAYISGGTFGSLGGTNAGGADAFLTKFDSSGNELWSQQIGTSWPDHSRSVAVDAFGNVYISGDTYGSLGGTNAGGADAFLVKYEVPEPATLSLLALGGLAVLRRRRQLSGRGVGKDERRAGGPGYERNNGFRWSGAEKDVQDKEQCDEHTRTSLDCCHHVYVGMSSVICCRRNRDSVWAKRRHLFCGH